MKVKHDAVVAGHICLDIFPKFLVEGKPDLGELFVPGRLINMGPTTFSTGGAVSNTGLVMRILGLDVQLMGKIGKDLYGEGILSVLKKYQADQSMTEVEGEDTSYSVVLVPGEQDRIFLHFPGANDTFGAEDINYDIVGQSRLFHFGYPPLMKRMYQQEGKELASMYRRVKEKGVTTSLDMTLPDAKSESGRVDWIKLLGNVLPHVDVFLPSGEEAMFMLNRKRLEELQSQGSGDVLDRFTVEDVHSLTERILELGAKMAVIKMGTRGLFLRTAGEDRLTQMGAVKLNSVKDWANRQMWEEVFRVDKVASTTGAGDSTIAGFLSGLLAGMSITQCLKAATAVGGMNVQAVDALSGIRSWSETLANIQGWKKRRESLSSPGWRYDEQERVWIG